MTDFVRLGSTGGLICRVSHTATGESIYDDFAAFLANWTDMGEATLDDGTLLRWRGDWQSGAHYSADPLDTGDPADDDDSDDPGHDVLVPEPFRIGVSLGAPQTTRLYPEPFRIGVRLWEPIAELGHKRPVERTATPSSQTVHRAIRDRAFEYQPPKSSLKQGGHRIPLHLWSTEVGDAATLFSKGASGYPVGDQAGQRPDDPTSRYLYLEADVEKEPAGGHWALMVIRDVQRKQTDLAGSRFDVSGAVIIDVFTLAQPRGPTDGVAVADTAAIDSFDALAIATEFQRVYDSGVVRFDGGRAILSGASINEVGISGKWYQVRVTAPFLYYQTR